MTLGDPEPEFLVLKILRARNKFFLEFGCGNALISTYIVGEGGFRGLEFLEWCGSHAGRTRQGGGGHMTILKLRAGTAVHDFKIDQY